MGITTVKYDNGWANFTDLAISHFGADFVLDFAVTYPAAASFSLSSSKFSLTRRPLKVNIRNITTTIMQNSDVAIELELQDGVTSQVVEKISWRVCE